MATAKRAKKASSAASARDLVYDRIVALMARHRPQWRMAYAGFQSRYVVTLAGARWIIGCRIHTDLPKPGFRASVTLWPPGRARTLAKMKPADREALERLERTARRAGYRGKWQQVRPTIGFGDYWKSLKNEKAVAAEIEKLNSVEWGR